MSSIPGKNISIRAGRRAIQIIRDEGFKPERVRVLSGAAGGPKWIVLYGIDRVLPGLLLDGRKKPLYLAASSIASWRFAALAQKDPLGAHEKFREAYFAQQYSSRPLPEEVTSESTVIMNRYVTDDAVRHILSHPVLHFSMFSVLSRHLCAMENRFALGLGMAGTGIANLLNRRLVGAFFQRTLFYDGRDVPPFFEMDGFVTHRVPLSNENFRDALLASGSIPLVMSGVKDIPDAPRGVYRDGGIIDYHLDIPYGGGDDLVLFPHYTDRIIPGWFDKPLKWRKPNSVNMENVVMVSPSERFISNLPYGKIPDRNDFYNFAGDDEGRLKYWNTVKDESKKIGEELVEAVESNSIKKIIQPL